MLLIVAWLIAFGVNLQLAIGCVLYMLALVALFFLPLMSVHQAMSRAKERELSRCGRLFHDEYASLPRPESRAKETERTAVRSTRESVAYLGELDSLYRRVEMMPVWPFDVSTVTRFFSVIVVPLILFGIQLATEDALTKLFQRVFG